MTAEAGGTPSSPCQVGAVLAGATRVITQERIDAYRAASGDHNPIHYDTEFAAGTRFGGIIAQGMLTLALVSELMAGSYGADWLTTGRLQVRFRGAAFPGDALETVGVVSRCESADNGIDVTCNVEVRNAHNGNQIITGSASLRVSTARQEVTPE